MDRNSQSPESPIQAWRPASGRRTRLPSTFYRLARPLGWGGSLLVHAVAVFLFSLVTWQVVVTDKETIVITTSFTPAHEVLTGQAKVDLLSHHETPPTDPGNNLQSNIVVPPEILAMSELGDHFETLNPDRPDRKSAFGNPETHLFSATGIAPGGGGGVGGFGIGELLGIGGSASPGTGGGWGGGNGTGIGLSNGAGHGSYGQRNGGGRRLMVMRFGGASGREGLERLARTLKAGARLDPSVEAALSWLAAHQEPEGRWDTLKHGGKSYDTAVTSLALLSFLSAGQTEEAGRYREAVRRAVGWLLAQQRPDGSLGAGPDVGYTHGIAGLSLAQAARTAGNPETRGAAQRAVRWSCTRGDEPGTPAGAWRYQGPAADGDLSVSGWFILQLKTAQAAGLEVPEASLSNAARFLDRVTAKSEDGAPPAAATFQYRPGTGGGHRLDAIGNTCRLLLADQPAATEEGVQHPLTEGPAPRAGKTDLYYWYYGTLCASRRGGDAWRRWSVPLKAALSSSQRKDIAAAGSWDPEGEYASHWGRVGQTALATLCLEAGPKAPAAEPAQAPAGPADPAPLAQAGTPGPSPVPVPALAEEANAESYDPVVEPGFTRVTGEEALSTFAVDVDTASYSNTRRFLNENKRPPKGALRLEELINYFDYAYEPPKEDAFAVRCEVASCPWNPEHRLAVVALKGREIAWEKRPPGNLVFLVDTSGSMSGPARLPLVKKALRMLVGKLEARDRVAMVSYAGSSGLVLDATTCDRKPEILQAVERLDAGGSTNGGAGIELAYRVAEANLVKGGINRVILCTDGDFNVGVTSQDALVDLIQAKAKSGVFLTVLGFGMGNLKDGTLEKLADKGNGNYGYVDNEKEAQKLLVAQAGSTLVTIAKDVKVQVEFNPVEVAAYRLVGYENRLMAAKDFRDDAKDAGEIGAGHAVTALYEIVPAHLSKAEALPEAGPLKYQKEREASAAAASGELMTVYLRHKQPDEDRATERNVAVSDAGGVWEKASADFRWASGVAMFGMELRNSKEKGRTSWDLIEKVASGAKDADRFGYRAEFLELLGKARQVASTTPPPKPDATDEEF